MGINIDNLESLIKKNNFNLTSYNSNSEMMINTIKELNECYSGSSLDCVFLPIIDQNNNFMKISKVIGSYSDLLREVERGYKQQDINIKSQINKANSNV